MFNLVTYLLISLLHLEVVNHVNEINSTLTMIESCLSAIVVIHNSLVDYWLMGEMSDDLMILLVLLRFVETN